MVLFAISGFLFFMALVHYSLLSDPKNTPQVLGNIIIIIIVFILVSLAYIILW